MLNGIIFSCHSSVPKQHTGLQELGLVGEGGFFFFLWDWHNWNAISCQRAYSEVYYEFTGKALKFKWSLAEFFFFFNLQRNAGLSFLWLPYYQRNREKKIRIKWRVKPRKHKSSTKTEGLQHMKKNNNNNYILWLWYSDWWECSFLHHSAHFHWKQ